MRNDLQTLLKLSFPMGPGLIQIGERSRSQIGHESGSKARWTFEHPVEHASTALSELTCFQSLETTRSIVWGTRMFAHGLPA